MRRLGSAAIDLCYVAAGRLDGFWESDLKPWDIAGGALIVAEAGGRVTNMAGEPFTSRGGHVLATNGHLHEAMLDVIATFRQGRAPQADGLIPARDSRVTESPTISGRFRSIVLAPLLLSLSRKGACLCVV